MTQLRTIDAARAPMARALEIASRAAGYIEAVRRGVPGVPADHAVDAVEATIVAEDRAHARGCELGLALHRLYVVDRAWRIARQHLDGGPRFQLVLDALAVLAAHAAEPIR